MAEEKYRFIEEKIKPKKKRIIKEYVKKVGKLICSGAVFGIVAAFTGMLIFNLMGGTDLLRKTDEDNNVVPQNTLTPQIDDSNNEEEIDFSEISVEDYEALGHRVFKYAQLYEDTIVTVAKVKEGVDCFQNPIENSDSFSGLVIRVDSENMYFLTEYDGLDVSSSYQIIFRNGESIKATILGVDRETGLAIVSTPLSSLNSDIVKSARKALIGESTDIKEGDFVVAIGNPAGYMYSITYGVVLTKPNTQYITDRQISLFHTDMTSIDNGGGVVMDSQGYVVGIITHRFENEENNVVSFMGVSEIQDLLDILINNRRMPYIGIVASNISQEYLTENNIDYGIYVTEVKTGSPAAQAGLTVGDIVVSVAGEPIDNVGKYTEILASRTTGEEIEIEILRTYAKENEVKTYELVLTESKR